ncbi:unnamed protein product [Polarella glacialis]|uniref:Integral membrane bound transporter domain-containing protein n=1 Tax=Polarella glacialis TaxID=89957 RepID=A0A813DU89_POLGL|nr:unnamed protein product [Polarella glacialis]
MDVFRKADVQHGQMHEARSKVALRAALGSAACSALVFVPLMLHWSKADRLVSTACIAVGVFICFVTASRELGDTVKLSLTWAFSTPMYLAVGLAMTYLCYLVGGMSWNPWVIFTALPVTAFVFILWGEAAAEWHKPHPLFAGNHAVIIMALLPLAAMLDGGHDELEKPAMLAVGLVVSVLFGSVASLLLAFCPMGLGAAPAKCRVPSLAAANLFATADYADVLTLPWDQATASLARRRKLRFAASKAAVELKRIRETATLQRFGSSIADSDAMKCLATNTEACRMALNLSHTARERMTFNQGRQSRLGQELCYRGRLGEARMDLMVVASRALHAAGSVAASLAGAHPVQAVPGETTVFGSGHSDAEDCTSAAQDCRTALSNFKAVWEEFYSAGFVDRLKELSGGSTSESELLDAFLSGRLEILAAHANSDEETAFVRRATCDAESQIKSFMFTIQVSSDFMAVCSVAESAASVAEAMTEVCEDFKAADSKGGCQMPGGVFGFRAWLCAPFAGRSVWAAAFKKTGRHAMRMSIGICMAAGLALAVPQMFPAWNAPGFWTIATVSLCLTPTQGASLFKGGMRVLGTILGASLGLVSVTMAPGNLVSLWSHIFLVAYFLKFFEPELNYAGAVAFITYLFIIIVGTKSTEHVLNDEALLFAFHRVADVTLGVVITTLVSIFCLPDRAVDNLRTQEHEALIIAKDTVSTACRMLGHAASAVSTASTRQLQPVSLGPSRSSSSPVATGAGAGTLGLEQAQSLANTTEVVELRARTWECAEKLTFGGEGLGGVADLLTDVYWEAQIGTDHGSTCFFGCLWTPFRGLPCLEQPRQLASGENCLRASPFMNRLLRQCHILVSVLEPGLEIGAERILEDDKVREALGLGGSGGLAECVDGVVGALAAQLERPTADNDVSKAGDFTDLERAEAAAPTLDDVVKLMQCLMAGAGAARARIGGVVGKDTEGKSTGSGGLRAAVIIFMLHETINTLTLAREALSGGPAPAEHQQPRTKRSTSFLSTDISVRVVGDSVSSPQSSAEALRMLAIALQLPDPEEVAPAAVAAQDVSRTSA